MLNKINNDIDKAEIPNLPYDGKYVIQQGLGDGKKIGFALKELEKQWKKTMIPPRLARAELFESRRGAKQV
jgi:hypothetical protein